MKGDCPAPHSHPLDPCCPLPTMAHLARIDRYPIKSLPGETLTEVALLSSGALAGDRAYALVDGEGRFINAKRTPRIHHLRSRLNPDGTLTLAGGEDIGEIGGFPPLTAPLGDAALDDWFTRYFPEFPPPVHLVHDGHQGFPDDTASPGPTVVSTATLTTVAQWFDLSLEETRQRFRSNLEIDGVPPFWEDCLFGETGAGVPFRIGTVELLGINPCQRCVVPTRHPSTGVVTAQFAQRFGQERRETLGPMVARSPFNHFYRLAVNTRRPAPGPPQTLRVGDTVQVSTA